MVDYFLQSAPLDFGQEIRGGEGDWPLPQEAFAYVAGLRIWPYSLDRWELDPLQLRGVSSYEQLVLHTR